jgi:hypothetical protein
MLTLLARTDKSLFRNGPQAACMVFWTNFKTIRIQNLQCYLNRNAMLILWFFGQTMAASQFFPIFLV